MGGTIYFIGESGELIRMDEQAWDKEAEFQDILALHPDLLGADQIDANDPPRWLHIKGEAAVPDSDDLKARWSIDHLFLDQHGIPTLVEVKRSSDTRLRREVVGQMLDYAANSVAYWPIEHIQSALERRCDDMGLDPNDEVSALIGEDADIDAFWMLVKTNLQAGRVRMLFVADQIPPELHRIVEFLNQQMDPAQVLAVEVKRFTHGDRTALVPRVMGQTAEAAARKTVRRPGRQWDKDSVFSDLSQHVGPRDMEKAKAIFDWIGRNDLRVTYGSGAGTGSFSAKVQSGGNLHSLFHVYSSGQVEHPFASFKAPFESEERRLALIERLRGVGLAFTDEQITKRPSMDLEDIAEDRLEGWLAVWEWMVREIQDESGG